MAGSAVLPPDRRPHHERPLPDARHARSGDADQCPDRARGQPSVRVHEPLAQCPCGFALFIISDLFDSADGQLARRRGTSTRLGRALDGTSDGVRFLNLGVHLVIRLVLFSGWSWMAAVPLAVIASFSHTSQSATIDFVRHAFLALGKGKGSELDVDEVDVPAEITWFQRFTTSIYRSYARLQARLFPQTVALVRATRGHRTAPGVTTPGVMAAYRERMLPLLSWCPWLGQNIRFIVLGITAVAGWPSRAAVDHCRSHEHHHGGDCQRAGTPRRRDSARRDRHRAIDAPQPTDTASGSHWRKLRGGQAPSRPEPAPIAAR